MQAMREAQMQDKKTLAISMLVEGRPQAFVDFFQLTHTSTARAHSADEAAAPEELPQDSLLLLKNQLVKADAARKAGNVEEVYGAYKHLAKYFAQLGRLRTAEFFFKQCLYISRDSGWLPGELEANLALGVVYEELRDLDAAITCHERRLELATDNQLAAEADTAYHSLTTVYMGQAEEREKAGDVQGSLDSYTKCLRAADKAGDVPAAAKANFRMGMLYNGQDKWQDAMYFLRRYIELSSSSTAVDRSTEGVAHTTYAQCLQQVGDTASAVSSLEAYLETMSRWVSCFSEDLIRDQVVRCLGLRGCSCGAAGLQGALLHCVSATVSCKDAYDLQQLMVQPARHLRLSWVHNGSAHIITWPVSHPLATSVHATHRAVMFSSNRAHPRRGQEQSGPAIACCSLGILYYNQGRNEQAVTYFERFFEIARELPDRRALDAARFNLGVARGAVRMQVRAYSVAALCSFVPLPVSFYQLFFGEEDAVVLVVSAVNTHWLLAAPARAFPAETAQARGLHCSRGSAEMRVQRTAQSQHVWLQQCLPPVSCCLLLACRRTWAWLRRATC